jgi:hypothetical protein
MGCVPRRFARDIRDGSSPDTADPRSTPSSSLSFQAGRRVRRSASKSRGAIRVAAQKNASDAAADVDAEERNQRNVKAIAGAAAAAAIMGNTGAAMADAYDDYVKALETQNIKPAEIQLAPEAPKAAPKAQKTAPAPKAAKAVPKVDKEAAAAAKAAKAAACRR